MGKPGKVLVRPPGPLRRRAPSAQGNKNPVRCSAGWGFARSVGLTMNTVRVSLPRVLIMQADKPSGEQVANTMSRYGFSVVGPFVMWAEASAVIQPDALE